MQMSKLEMFMWAHFPGWMTRIYGHVLGSKGYTIGFNCSVPSSLSAESSVVNMLLTKLKATGFEIVPLHSKAAASIRDSGVWRDRLGKGVNLVVLADCKITIPMADSSGQRYGSPSCRFRLSPIFQAENGATIRVESVEVHLGYDYSKPMKQYGRDDWAFLSYEPKALNSRRAQELVREAYEQIVKAAYVATYHPLDVPRRMSDSGEWPFGDAPAELLSC